MRNLSLALTPANVQIVAGAASSTTRNEWADGKATERLQNRDGHTLYFLDGVLVAYNGTNLDVQVQTTTPLPDTVAVGTQFQGSGTVELALRGTVQSTYNGGNRAELVGTLFIEKLTPVGGATPHKG